MSWALGCLLAPGFHESTQTTAVWCLYVCVADWTACPFCRNQRKVPAHMPHMIDVEVMTKVQDTCVLCGCVAAWVWLVVVAVGNEVVTRLLLCRFSWAFDATSAHRFRDAADIQFAFAYFTFIMEGGAQEGIDVDTYWQRELDTDMDGYVVHRCVASR